MTGDETPYRTERESDDLAVVMTIAFAIAGGLVRLTTGYALAAALAGMAVAYAVQLVANQIAMRRGAELVSPAEGAKRKVVERAAIPMWTLCLKAAINYGTIIIVLNLLTMQESDLWKIPFLVVASPLFGAGCGLFLALRARWQVGRMASS
jgi:hypothetical protein